MAWFDSTKNSLVDAYQNIESIRNDLRKRTELATGLPFPSRNATGQVTNTKAVIWQVRGIAESLNIPDLVMKVNPRSLNKKFTQLINRKRTIGGFIEEHWGEQLDTMSASGITGSFFGDYGLTNFARRDTTAFTDFEELVDIYRNNGSVYDHKTGGVVAQGFIVMNYDGSVYHGYFESFSTREGAEKPFNLEYDFVFKVTNEEFPGRKTSFKQIKTVLRPGAPKSDVVSLDIVGTRGVES